jgi:DNA processing protein
VTIVVEAPVKSGALNTALQADALGRTLGVVPGPIDVEQAQGSNGLLRDGGAVMISDVADALALVGLTPPVRVPRSLDPDAAAVWSALADGPLDSDALCAKSRLPAQRCMAAVSELEVHGAVECALTGLIQRR